MNYIFIHRKDRIAPIEYYMKRSEKIHPTTRRTMRYKKNLSRIESIDQNGINLRKKVKL